MMGIIGNKTLLVSPIYYKTAHLFSLMICTIAGWQAGVKFIGRAWWVQNTRTQPKTFLCGSRHVRVDNTSSKSQTTEK